MRNRNLVPVLASALSIVALAAPAYAQSGTFQIAPGRLKDAIDAYARQTGRQIIYRADDVANAQSPGVRGRMAADAALAKLLGGTGFSYRVDASGAIAILLGERTAGGAAADDERAEIVVTGSRLTNGGGATERHTYDAKAIRDSGQPSISAFLNTLPEVSIASAGSGVQVFGAGNTVRLRGLPAGATLVLLNGRRLAVSAVGSTGIFNIDDIPAALVARVDVIPVGSSAIYGSDSIGGVVNIVTKSDFKGFAVDASSSFADAYHESRGSMVFGHRFDRGSIMAMAAYREHGAIFGRDLAITSNNDYRRYASEGGIDYRQPYCNPGTVTAVSGVLNGVGNRVAAIPGTGAVATANYRAGVTNLCNYYASQNVIPKLKTASAVLTGEYALTDQLTLFTENIFTYSSVRAIVATKAVAGALVPANNVFNPFGQAVTVNTNLPVRNGSIFNTDMFRPLVGVRGDFGGIDLELSAWDTILRERAINIGGIVSPSVSAVLANPATASKLDLFDLSANDPAFLSSLLPRTVDHDNEEDRSVSGTARTSVRLFGARRLALATGFEYRHERLDAAAYNGGDPSALLLSKGTRSVASAFAEAQLAVVGPRAGASQDMLSLDAAARYDHYSDFGGKVSPQIGLIARPFEQISLRGTYSTAFKAPLIKRLVQSRQTSATNGTYFDPARGQTTGLVSVVQGGNPDLKPELGNSLAGGIDWSSQSALRPHLSATYWRITERDRIITPLPAAILANEALFPGRVVRAASSDGLPGQVVSIDASNVNFGGLHVSGLDVDGGFTLPTGFGTLSPGFAVTRTLTYTSQLTPGGAWLDRLSRAVNGDSWAPRWKATAFVTVEAAPVRLSVAMRYTGEYLDYQTVANPNRLGDQALLDASIAFDIKSRAAAKPMATFRLSVVNIANTGPRFSNLNGYGFDINQVDPIGRLITVALSRTF